SRGSAVVEWDSALDHTGRVDGMGLDVWVSIGSLIGTAIVLFSALNAAILRLQRDLKGDIARVEATIARVETDMSMTRTDLSTEISTTRTDLTTEILATRTDLTTEISATRTDRKSTR